MRLLVLALVTAGFSIAQTPTFYRDVAPILERLGYRLERAKTNIGLGRATQ